VSGRSTGKQVECTDLSEEAVVDVLDDAGLLVELAVVLSVQLRPATDTTGWLSQFLS